MARTLVRQATQVHNSDVYDDTIAPAEAAFETNPADIETDLNNLRSMASELRDGRAGDWFNALIAPVTFESGAIRGVQDNNQDLHDLERKRWLRAVKLLVDVTVGGTDDFVILGTGELPTQTTAAVGAVTTRGTVVAEHAGTFGTHALDEVGGAHALAPKNLNEITDASGDPILSAGKRVWALMQTENGADGHTITDTTPNRVQLSFVIANAANTDLIACPAADIQGQDIRYCYVERLANVETTEQDFMAQGAAIDIGAGAASVTRQVAYDNQGATPVDQITNAILDLEGAGLAWRIRDDLEAVIFELVEGSAGGTTQFNIPVAVDEFDIDALVNNFDQGVSMASGKTRPIDVGVNDGLIESTAGDLEVKAAGELILNDANMVGEGTWAGPGVKVTEDAGEVTAYEAAFGGEVSLFNAIVQAANSTSRRRVQAVVTANVAANADVSGPANDNNLDVDLGDLSGGTFVTDYDIFTNGALQRNGVNAAADEDVYPGTALADGQLRFEYSLKGTGGNPDVITVIDHVA